MSEKHDDLYHIRHTAAHVLAQAVLDFYPEAKLGIGPPIDDGFYYDFDLGVAENGRSRTFSPRRSAQTRKTNASAHRWQTSTAISRGECR